MVDVNASSIKKGSVNEKILESLNNVEYISKIKSVLRDKYRLDVHQYRSAYFLRRISMISKRLHTNDVKEIYNHINNSHDGYLDFLNTLTIHVTEFFRDKSVWEYLRDELFFPYILGELNNEPPTVKNPFKIWSAGCSSGQEPYSLAIMFIESYKKYLKKKYKAISWNKSKISSIPVKIYASDINKEIILKAKEGKFIPKTLRNADPKLIREYFTKEKDAKGNEIYLISEEVKKLVKFEVLDLFKSKFPARLNLITCRNVVIYFTKDQQKILFKKFYDSLYPNQFMVTGKSELLPLEMKECFSLIKLSEHFYRKKQRYVQN